MYIFQKKCRVFQIQPISKPTKNTKHHKNWLIWKTPINGSVFQNFEYMSSPKKTLETFAEKKHKIKNVSFFLFHPLPPPKKKTTKIHQKFEWDRIPTDLQRKLALEFLDTQVFSGSGNSGSDRWRFLVETLKAPRSTAA